MIFVRVLELQLRTVDVRPETEIQTPTAQDLSPIPTAEELEVLSSFERFALRLVQRMNRGKWKRFWTWCQSTMGAGWIHLSTYNIMNVYGLEHVEAVSRDRPLVLVA